MGNFPFGSWELSFVQNGNTYTVGESKAVVPRADGSHLIYDDPPSNEVFPYLKNRDLDSSEDPKDDNFTPVLIEFGSWRNLPGIPGHPAAQNCSFSSSDHQKEDRTSITLAMSKHVEQKHIFFGNQAS